MPLEHEMEITSNTDAIYKEFSFLDKLQPRSETKGAFVIRLGEEHLMKSTSGKILDGHDNAYHILYLLNEEGEIVTTVGYTVKAKWFFGKDRLQEENLSQTLFRLGDRVSQVHYLIEVSTTLNPTTNYVILLKIPKGYENLGDWYDYILSKDRQKIDEV